MILAGDIGGTKSLFGLFDGPRCLVERRLTNADFAGFDAALSAFLATHPDTTIDRACFALAGPVEDGQRRARLTNLDWTLDADRIASAHYIGQVGLINDFVAAALGAVTSAPADRVSLQVGTPLDNGPRLILGAGTGLGVAWALPQPEGHWRIIAGEGGHMGFSPADARQDALVSFLRQRHGRVSWERVVSGPGLSAIHEFLGGGMLTPDAIARAARADQGGMAAQALDLFLAAYGAVAGDLALATLSRGGIFLAGGIAPALLAELQNPCGPFLRAFHAKAEHATLMPQMPLWVVTDASAGLRGAALVADGHDADGGRLSAPD